MRGIALRLAALILVLTSAVLPARAQGETVAIRAGRILTMAGDPIENGTIVIRDGRIVSVAAGDAVPEGARVLDATGSVVMPGLVDANVRCGTRGDDNEDSEEITPAFQIGPAVDAASLALKRAVQLGVTTARITPGNSDVICGEGAIWKTAGGPIGGRPVSGSGELKVVVADDPAWGNDVPWYTRPNSFYFRQPTTRMGVVWLLRQALFRAQSGKPSPPDPILVRALAGDMPVHVLVRTAVDIETVLRTADEFGLTRLVLDECTEGYKMTDVLAARGIPVILGPLYAGPVGRGGAKEASLNNAGLLSDAGVKVAIASNDPSGPAPLLHAAAMAFRDGMHEGEALRAVTRTPAEILGIADRVGSLEPGKDADLLILSGPPLQFTTRIEKVLVGGRVVFDARMGADVDG